MNDQIGPTQPLSLATRASPLAIRQAGIVQQHLQRVAPHIAIALFPMQTLGDRVLQKEHANMAGKGLFLKEIEEALLDGRCRLAVHSLKDVPFSETMGLTIAATLQADDPRDVLVSREGLCLEELPRAASIGTNSLRRRAQVLSARPDLHVMPLQGNVGTRLQKLFDGHYDAIVLAAAGLQRLGLANVNLTSRNLHFFETLSWLPAPCQGVLGLQCRHDDLDMLELLKALDDVAIRQRTVAERSFAARLGADCKSALAAHALGAPHAQDQTLELHGWVATPTGSNSIRMSRSGPRCEASALGAALAEDFLRAGAEWMLHGCPQLP